MGYFGSALQEMTGNYGKLREMTQYTTQRSRDAREAKLKQYTSKQRNKPKRYQYTTQRNIQRN